MARTKTRPKCSECGNLEKLFAVGDKRLCAYDLLNLEFDRE